MATTIKKHGTTYEAVYDVPDSTSRFTTCEIRRDDSGFFNIGKAWYLFAVHLLAAIALMIGIFRIDRHEFEIGGGPTIFAYGSLLYQAQVTGLISLGLVTLRLVAGSCSALLAWRIVYILLGDRGITLAELTRLTNFRIPVLPAKGSCSSVLWSIWAVVAIILIWPQGFAAPLASSSVSWIPGTRILQDPEPVSVAAIGEKADWASMLYQDARVIVAVGAAATIARDPAYAFHTSQLPLRRYFNSSRTIPDGSKIDFTVPYFSVDLRWIDASSDNRSENAGSPEYQGVNNDFGIRTVGSVGIVRDEPWDPQSADPQGVPRTFVGKKLVAVKLRTLNFGDVLGDGTVATNTTQCLTKSEVFGQLPDVNQHQSSITNGEETVAYDCYIVAEATITAGIIPGKDCIVTTSTANGESYATCHTRRDDSVVQTHWLTILGIEFLSEALKYSVMQNYTQPWISNNLTDYTSGMLTLGYHAAWSSLMSKLVNGTEPTTYNAASPIVIASINHAKLYIWLAMHAALTISAVLVSIAQVASKTKTLRDTTLGALTLDLTDIMHSGNVEGLCNAVALDKQDKKLPRMVWRDDKKATSSTGIRSCRKIALADDPSGEQGLHRRHNSGCFF